LTQDHRGQTSEATRRIGFRESRTGRATLGAGTPACPRPQGTRSELCSFSRILSRIMYKGRQH